MSTNDVPDAGVPVAVTAARVASVLAIYRRAQDAAVVLRGELAARGLPHGPDDVVATVDPWRGGPVVYLRADTPQHRRAVRRMVREAGSVSVQLPARTVDRERPSIV